MAKKVMSPPTAGDTEPEKTGLMKDSTHEQEFYLDPSGGFVAYDREDKWSSTSYDKRYMDALASVLLISRESNKVAAITQVGDIYYLAYNDARKDSFKQNYESKLLELLECLNARNWEKLLALHIVHSRVDFLKILENGTKFPEKSLLKNDLDLVHGSTAGVGTIEQAITSMEKQIEKIKEIEGTKSIAEIIKCAFKQIVTIGISSVCKSYIGLVASLKTSEDRHNVSEVKLPNELMKLILRPLQNVVKLADYIGNKLPELELKLGENFIFLDEVEARIEDVGVVHAEVRLAHHLGKKLPDVEGFYIGASRLCCAGCHKVLDDGGYEHRGTSGIFFPGWKCVDKGIPGKLIINAIESAEEKSLLSQETEYTSRTGGMQRDLSEDPDYEKTVIREVSLLEIKKELGISETYKQLRVEEKQSDKVAQDADIAFMEIDKEEHDVPASGESAKPFESDE